MNEFSLHKNNMAQKGTMKYMKDYWEKGDMVVLNLNFKRPSRFCTLTCYRLNSECSG